MHFLFDMEMCLNYYSKKLFGSSYRRISSVWVLPMSGLKIRKLRLEIRKKKIMEDLHINLDVNYYQPKRKILYKISYFPLLKENKTLYNGIGKNSKIGQAFPSLIALFHKIFDGNQAHLHQYNGGGGNVICTCEIVSIS